jgi:DNA-binding HxlR family transcriptional regulator
MKSSTSSQNCSAAQTLEIVGERWAILIVREAFFGTRRFGDFQARLGVARNILATRLAKLVEARVLTRREERGRGAPTDYRLTERGRELLPVLIALMQWGDKWLNADTGEPVRIVEAATSDPIATLRIQTRAGRILDARDLRVLSGPGADPTTRARFANAQAGAGDVQ